MVRHTAYFKMNTKIFNNKKYDLTHQRIVFSQQQTKIFFYLFELVLDLKVLIFQVKQNSFFVHNHLL